MGPIASVEASNSRRRRLPLTSLARTSVRRLLDSAWERRRLQLCQWSKRLTGFPKMYRRWPVRPWLDDNSRETPSIFSCHVIIYSSLYFKAHFLCTNTTLTQHIILLNSYIAAILAITITQGDINLANVVLMLSQRRRRWANINTTWVQSLMFAGKWWLLEAPTIQKQRFLLY